MQRAHRLLTLQKELQEKDTTDTVVERLLLRWRPLQPACFRHLNNQRDPAGGRQTNQHDTLQMPQNQAHTTESHLFQLGIY